MLDLLERGSDVVDKLNSIHESLCAIRNSTTDPSVEFSEGDLDVPLQHGSFNLIVVYGHLPLHDDCQIISDIQEQAQSNSRVNRELTGAEFHRMSTYYVGTQCLAISPQPVRALLENETVSATVLQGGMFDLDIRKQHGIFCAQEHIHEMWWCMTYDRVDGWPTLSQEQMMKALEGCLVAYAREVIREELLPCLT